MAELFHVGLTVSDCERSVAFYRDVVGMELEIQADHATPQFDELTSNPGARLRVAHLRAGSFMLQVIQYLQRGGPALDLHHNNIGSPHLAFFVPDVVAKYRDLKARGDVLITSDLIVNGSKTLHSFYVEDPDGVPVEFLERLVPPSKDKAK